MRRSEQRDTESKPVNPPATARVPDAPTLRCQVVHWRFQVLIDAYPERATSTVEDVWVWGLNAEREIRELLGVDSDVYDTMREVRHQMRVVDIQPWRRRRKDYLTDEVFGRIRAGTWGALLAAVLEEQEDRTMVRVVDLHPWIAAAAEPLFDDGHRRQAIIAAAQNLEKQWRELLGVATPTLTQLAQESFSTHAPTPEHPRLRYPAVGTDTNSQAWKDAHVGAMEYAKGCAMRIRNLNLHHPEDAEPGPGETVETLSALSVLARWVTEAELRTGDPA